MELLYFDDWAKEPCLETGFVHGTLPPPLDGYPIGDRLMYMTCQRCGVVVWGFYTIKEWPF